jgi:hypothetical protein
MPFRAILVAAAIAMATIGVASPASTVPECMGPDYINSDGVCVHDPEQVPKGPHYHPARPRSVQMATTRLANTPIPVAHVTAMVALHSTCNRGLES